MSRRESRCRMHSGLGQLKPLFWLAAFLVLATVAGCGRRGAPSPPGPPDQITWPRVYPTQ